MIKNKKSNYLVISAILGALFLLLSFLVNKDVFRNLDYDTLVALQGAFGRYIDLPFSVLTLLGSSEVTLFATGIIFLLLIWRKKHIFAGIFLIFAIYVFELIGKILIYHPKPPAIFSRYILNIFFPSSFVVQTNYSYPSGHMARTSFVAVIISFLLLSIVKNKFQRVMFSLAPILFIILIFVSRIYLGEHWFSDVLGGLLLGASISTFALAFW